MQLSDLSPTQLARLADRAQGELDRRQARKPVATVREQLARAAADEGYTLADVFPEFLEASASPPSTGEATPAPTAAPRTEPSRTDTRKPATPPPPAPDPARTIVKAAASIAATRPGMPILLAPLRDAAGMQSDWSAFHAALEQAVKRGWLYFSGNDACLLTADGEASAAGA